MNSFLTNQRQGTHHITCFTQSGYVMSKYAPQLKQVLLGQKEAAARIRGGLRRDGPNEFLFVYNLIQKDLSISNLFVFIFLFC